MIYQRLMKFASLYLAKIGEVLPLRKTLQDRGIGYDQMTDIEHEAFDKYEEQLGWNPADNAYSLRSDIEDDETHIGHGVFDGPTLRGYIYGNKFDADDLPDDPEDLEITNYTDLGDEELIRLLRSKARSGKMFYVSNLALPRHKIKIVELFQKLFADVKSKGYQYLVFDALSDTSKLFMNADNTPKQDRLDKANLMVLATATDDGQHIMTILQMTDTI